MKRKKTRTVYVPLVDDVYIAVCASFEAGRREVEDYVKRNYREPSITWHDSDSDRGRCWFASPMGGSVSVPVEVRAHQVLE